MSKTNKVVDMSQYILKDKHRKLKLVPRGTHTNSPYFFRTHQSTVFNLILIMIMYIFLGLTK